MKKLEQILWSRKNDSKTLVEKMKEKNGSIFWFIFLFHFFVPFSSNCKRETSSGFIKLGHCVVVRDCVIELCDEIV